MHVSPLQVSTLFEEASIFPLKAASVELSCTIDPPATQEEMAQSAHLMTLGLCRISATRPPLPPPSAQHRSPTNDSPRRLQSHPLKERRTDSGTDGVQTYRRRKLPCSLCPLMLSSRRLLDVHVRSHQAVGGFNCVCCSVTADSWEELEPHWRSHCRKRRMRKEIQKKKEEDQASQTFSCPLGPKTLRISASRNTHQQSYEDSENSGQNTLYCTF